jgi:hypothetical protein
MSTFIAYLDNTLGSPSNTKIMAQHMVIQE